MSFATSSRRLKKVNRPEEERDGLLIFDNYCIRNAHRIRWAWAKTLIKNSLFLHCPSIIHWRTSENLINGRPNVSRGEWRQQLGLSQSALLGAQHAIDFDNSEALS